MGMTAKRPDMTTLEPKKQKAIEALLREPNTAQAAKAAGISESTIHRYLNEPEFIEAYKETRARLLEGTLTLLQAASLEAVKTLQAIMNNKRSPVPCRLGAARTLLEWAFKGREILEIEERLRILEETLKARPKADSYGFR